MAAKYTVGVAGTTNNTLTCVQALASDDRFEIIWALTPPPQPRGRKQEITPNPLHSWAEGQQVPTYFVEKKISAELKDQLAQPDFLLVVDFGYLVPAWLLDLPKIAPVNIHPSALPKWRGSSPGQFVMLYGEKESAQTIMVMGEGMDTGPILWQQSFAVEHTWTQPEYYSYSFALAAENLTDVLIKTAEKEILPIPQPTETPTPIARRLKKDDGFVAWKDIAQLAQLPFQETSESDAKTSPLLMEVTASGQSLENVISHAVRALSPWPGVWTLMPTKSGSKRMKILSVSVVNGKLELEKVQIEGQQPAQWKEVQTAYAFLSAGR